MKSKILPLASVIWSSLVALGFSALVHSTDDDVGGLNGILTSSSVVSVVAIAVLLLVPMQICVGAHRRRVVGLET